MGLLEGQARSLVHGRSAKVCGSSDPGSLCAHRGRQGPVLTERLTQVVYRRGSQVDYGVSARLAALELRRTGSATDDRSLHESAGSLH